MISPVSVITLFVVGGVGSVAGFAAFDIARKIAPRLDPEDLIPMLPPAPPVPRFFYTKPELLEELKKNLSFKHREG